MRLIDADALRKAFKNHPLCHDIWLTYSRELIDNAPTVKITLIPADETKAEERPQGKWYRTGQSFINPNKFRNYGCSVCRYELDEHIREEPNFCPNCGAKMQTSD